MSNVNEWVKSIATAVDRSNSKITDVANDIRDFFPTSKPILKPKNRLIIAFKESLKEKATTIRNRSQKNILNLFSSLNS